MLHALHLADWVGVAVRRIVDSVAYLDGGLSAKEGGEVAKYAVSVSCVVCGSKSKPAQRNIIRIEGVKGRLRRKSYRYKVRY